MASTAADLLEGVKEENFEFIGFHPLIATLTSFKTEIGGLST